MDHVQDHKPLTIPSGHESHGVHLCHRCGWPFPNPHPSARHRRAHKKICGTIEGYTLLIGGSEVVSDDEEKTPSPKIEKKQSIGSGIGGSLSRSEDDLFSDAVTDFSDSGISAGSVNKTLDKDLFFSFKDAENGDAHDWLNAPMEISKVDSNLNDSKKLHTHEEKIGETEITNVCDSSESKLELTETDGLVKDGFVEPTPEQNNVTQSLEVESIDVVEAGEEKSQESETSENVAEEAKDSELSKMALEVSATVDTEVEKGQESQTSENITEEAKDSEMSKTTPEVSAKVEENRTSEIITEDAKDSEMCITTPEVSTKVQESQSSETITEDAKDSEMCITTAEVSAKVQESQTSEIITEEAKDSEMCKTTPEVSETVGGYDDNVKQENMEKIPDDVVGGKLEAAIADEISEEIKHEKLKSESDCEHVSEVVKESETDNGVEGIIEEIKHGKFELDHEIAPEIVEESETDQSVEGVGEEIKHKKIESDHEHDLEVVKEPEIDQKVSVLTEKDDLGAPESEECSKEQIQEVEKEPVSVLTEKEDLDAPKSETCSKEQILEVEKEPVSVLTEKDNLGAPNLEKCSNEQVHEVVEEPKVDDDCKVVADVSIETIALKEAEESAKILEHSSNNSIANKKNDSGIVPEPVNNQESGAALSVDSSSRNSVEGNWGSVSVLSTASIDAETIHTIDKSKVNSAKSNAADTHSGTTSDAFEAPSFMTLVEPEGKDQKSEMQDSLPTLTKVNNQSEGRKKNEEVIAKVANWSTGKRSTPLKNLLGEAKTPNAAKEMEVKKDEGGNEKAGEGQPVVNNDMSSPPKLIDDGKKGTKKVKGKGSWMPFVCCSSVNVN